MSAQRKLQQQSGCKRRDERHRVLIRAKMRAGGLPIDVCIRDVSLRGVCVVSEMPPPRGTVVELAGPLTPIVGEVVWSTDKRFGIAVGGRIDLPRLLAQRPGGQAPHELVPLPAYARAPVDFAQCAEESRIRGRAMQFAITGLLCASAAGLIGQLVYEHLRSAADQVRSALTAAH